MPHHQAFVDYFTHEFMEELWYLQKVARGDIPARKEVDPWEKFYNVTQGLLSLAPIPGLPLGFLISKELIKKCIDYGEKAAKLAHEMHKQAKAAYDKSQEFLAKVDELQAGYESLAGKPESKGMLQQEGPMDLTAIRVLVELVGRGLVERYEHVLTECLDTSNPEKSYIPLARVMAKRLFEYLQSQPLLAGGFTGDWMAQSTRLLHGVVLAKVDKSWREQITDKAGSLMPKVLQDMHKVTLPLQEAPKKRLGRLEKFTAEGVIVESAWYDAKQSYAHKSTTWQTSKDQPLSPKSPKYGYAYLADAKQHPLEMKAVVLTSPPPHNTRYYRSVNIADIQAYLSSPQVQAARKTKKTSDYSFHDFLRAQGHPAELQAVCHEELSAILDWSFANFQGVDFSGVWLNGNLSGTHFGSAYLVGATAKDVFCDKAHPVNLSKARLGFGDWRGAKLPKADFSQADLSLINLSQADLTAIHIEGTIWYKADLTDVTRRDLLAEQAKHVEKAQRQLRASLAHMEKQLQALEQRLEPELAKLHALEDQSQQTAATTQKLEEKISQLQSAITEKTTPLQQQIAVLQQQMAQRAGAGKNAPLPAQLSAQIQQLQQQVSTLNAPVQQQIELLETQVKNAAERMNMVTVEIANVQNAIYEDVNKAFKEHSDLVLQRLDERMDGLDKNIAGVKKRVDEQAGGINQNIAGVQQSLGEHAGGINKNIADVQQRQDQMLDNQKQFFAALEKQQQAAVAMQPGQPELAKLLKELLAQEFGSLKRVLIQLKPPAPAEQKPAPQQSVPAEQPRVEPAAPTAVERAQVSDPVRPERSRHSRNLSLSPSHQPATPPAVVRPAGVSSPTAPSSSPSVNELKAPSPKVSFFQQNQQQALQDNPVAMYNLAEAYYHGDGVTQDHKAALQWYQKAADKGHVAAQCELGIMFFKGKGTAQNADRAFELFQLVASQHGKATFMLGYCHERGRGAPQDFKKALSYYQKAADQGHTEAQQRHQAVAQHLGLVSAAPASSPRDKDNYATPKQNFPSGGPNF